MKPSPAEERRKAEVLAAVCLAVREGRTVRLPPYDPLAAQPGETALASVGIEPGPYGGTVGPLRYLFEGEEDVLHLLLARLDQGELEAAEARAAAAWILEGLAPGLVWYRPGRLTHHFYCGHDDLLAALG